MKLPQPERGAGIYAALSNEDYHADMGAFSASMLKILGAGSLAHLYAYICGARKEPTEAMKLGAMTHSYILDNAKLVPHPPSIKVRRGAEWEKFKAECDSHGAIPVSPSEFEDACGMRDSLSMARMQLDDGRRVRFGDILAGCKKEHSVYAVDSETDLMCRCRPDLLTPEDSNVIFDVKTCASGRGRQDHFKRQIAQYEYHVAAAHYLKTCHYSGICKSAFICIAVESEPPYMVSWNRIGPKSMETGRCIISKRMDMIAAAIQTGNWDGYGNSIIEQELPEWYVSQDIL